MVHVTKRLMNPDWRSTARDPLVFKVPFNGGNRIHTTDTASDFRAHGFGHFFFGHGAVGAKRKDNAHIFVGHAQAVHLIDQDWHKVKAIGDSGRVITDEGHGLPRVNAFF